MDSIAEKVASRCLRAVLAPLSVGTEIEESDEFRTFQSALEHLIPSVLVGVYPLWQYESLDAFRFAVARKIGSEEAEFIGLCLLISDMCWTPFYLRLRIASQSDSIEWLDCKLGETESDDGEMLRLPYGSRGETGLLSYVTEYFESIQWTHIFESDNQRIISE